MFDRLVDVAITFIELFQCWTYVDEFDEGVVLRCGRFNRSIGPGWQWLWPLGIERAITVNVRPEPMWIDVQSLHTSEDYATNIQIGLIWRITDVKTFLVDNENTENILAMLAAGVVARSIQNSKWAALRKARYPDTLKAPINRKVRKRGAEIDEVTVQDFASGSANRLWHEGITLSVGED